MPFQKDMRFEMEEKKVQQKVDLNLGRSRQKDCFTLFIIYATGADF